MATGQKPEGLFAFLFAEIGRAFQDVRQRVVEEGWFGRITTPLQRDHHSVGQGGPETPEAGRAVSFEDLWPRHDGASERARDVERGADIDR